MTSSPPIRNFCFQRGSSNGKRNNSQVICIPFFGCSAGTISAGFASGAASTFCLRLGGGLFGSSLTGISIHGRPDGESQEVQGRALPSMIYQVSEKIDYDVD